MKTSNPSTHFSRKLRELREDTGLTVEEFCKQFNFRYDGRMNKSTVSRYENGLQEPMISTVKKIAEFFSVNPSNLLGYVPASTSDASVSVLSPQLQTLADALDQLNEEGQNKLIDYAADLVSSGRYIKTSTVGLDQKQA